MMSKVYLVSYDVANNRKRKKLADKLLYYGLVRVQYSVFMGSLTTTLYTKLMQYARPLFEEEDRLIVLRLTETAVKQMVQFGEAELDMGYLIGQKHTLYFS